MNNADVAQWVCSGGPKCQPTLYAPPGAEERRVLMVKPGAPPEVLDALYLLKERESRQRRLRYLWDGAGVPRRYRGVSWDMWGKDDMVARAAREWARNPQRQFLILTGPEGTGKTTLATAVFREYMVQHTTSGLWVTWPDLVRHLKSAFGSPDYTAREQELFRTQLLLVDNLLDQSTDWQYEMLFALVNYRYNEMLPMIVTTNQDAAGLARTWGSQVASRFQEEGLVVVMNGRDHRRKGRR